MQDLMIDIETLDTIPESTVIISMGACLFDREKGIVSNETFFSALDIKEQLAMGRTASRATMLWWMRQDPQALKYSLSNQNKAAKVLDDLMLWIAHHTDTRPIDLNIWANSPAFDLVALRSLYKDLNCSQNISYRHFWDFRKERDFRTLKALLPLPESEVPQDAGIAHTPDMDAFWQAQYTVKVLKKLDKSK